MVNTVFSILDVKAEYYLPPQQAVTDAMAIRVFVEAAQDPKSMISRYPDDYVLFKLGTFNDADASYKLLDAKQSLGSARDLMPVVERGADLFDVPKGMRPASESPLGSGK